MPFLGFLPLRGVFERPAPMGSEVGSPRGVSGRSARAPKCPGGGPCARACEVLAEGLPKRRSPGSATHLSRGLVRVAQDRPSMSRRRRGGVVAPVSGVVAASLVRRDRFAVGTGRSAPWASRALGVGVIVRGRGVRARRLRSRAVRTGSRRGVAPVGMSGVGRRCRAGAGVCSCELFDVPGVLCPLGVNLWIP